MASNLLLSNNTVITYILSFFLNFRQSFSDYCDKTHNYFISTLSSHNSVTSQNISQNKKVSLLLTKCLKFLKNSQKQGCGRLMINVIDQRRRAKAGVAAAEEKSPLSLIAGKTNIVLS